MSLHLVIILLTEDFMATAHWHFDDEPPFDGFNNAAKDHFKGSRFTSLVREVIQNSIDAGSQTPGPVEVVFSIDELSRNMVPEIVSLNSSFQACVTHAREESEGNELALKFYEAGLKYLNSNSPVQILSIHDFNTSGLKGDVAVSNNPTARKQPWFSFVLAQGQSAKDAPDAGGSFGHGKNAPFAFSQISSVFYLTQIDSNDKKEQRFIGKSILQSMPRENGPFTQAVGYYSPGKDERYPLPLIDDAIPQWPKAIRGRFGTSDGTSLYIPFPIVASDTQSVENEIKFAIFANFFFSVYLGKLSVKVGDNFTLTKENLVHEFLKFEADIALSSNFDEVEMEKLDSARTIVNPMVQDKLEIDGFGTVLWFLRFGMHLPNKNTGIARSTGMLITRDRQPGMKRLSGVQNFDMFVSVQGVEGSKLLRKMENPAHNEFSTDRFDDEVDKRSAQVKFDLFIGALKKIVADYASIATESLAFDDALAELLSGDDKPEDSLNEEPRRNLFIGKQKRHKPRLTPIKVDGSETDEGDTGVSGGPNLHKNEGGDKGGTTAAGKNPLREIEIGNPRLVKRDGNVIEIYFTPSESGIAKLSLFAVGASDKTKIPLKFAIGSSEGTSLAIANISKNQRKSVLVSLTETSYASYLIQTAVYVEKSSDES